MKKISFFLNRHFTIATKLSEILACSVLALSLSSCASIVSRKEYPVHISSNPPGAHYLLKKENGTLVSEGVTPNTVVLKSSAGYFQPAKYVLFLDRKGEKQQFPFEARINPWYFGNFISWGLAGLVIVDPLTGAMWKLDDLTTVNFNS